MIEVLTNAAAFRDVAPTSRKSSNFLSAPFFWAVRFRRAISRTTHGGEFPDQPSSLDEERGGR